MHSAEQVVTALQTKARPDQLPGMARYGIAVERRLGVSIPELRKLAKQLGHDHKLALDLWKTGIAESRILASMIDEPQEVTDRQMEDWVKDFDSWDVCDQVCDNLFEKAPLAWKKITEWSLREEEFVKRAAFTLTACLAWHDKKAGDERFIEILPLIVRESVDERNYVKKSVNWALRNIGKRNMHLNKASIEIATQIRQLNSRSARWIAADAIRELESPAIQNKLRLRKPDKVSESA
jgi:3-methyladenine DNA glycosylase AlkD